MKKLVYLFTSFLMFFISNNMISQSHVTIGENYSACKNEKLIMQLVKYSVNQNIDGYNLLHNNKSCFYITKGIFVNVNKYTFDGAIVEISSPKFSGSIWTVKEAIIKR